MSEVARGGGMAWLRASRGAGHDIRRMYFSGMAVDEEDVGALAMPFAGDASARIRIRQVDLRLDIEPTQFVH